MPTPAQVLGLTQLPDVADLVPADVYSTRVIEALYAARKLAGIVSAVREDLTAIAGSTIQVPFMAPRTPQGPIAEGDSLTPNDEVTGTYPITLQKFGDYDLVNREVFEDQTIFSQDDFVSNMANGLAELVDQKVYDALKAATAGSTAVLTGALGTLGDLYDRIADLKGKMKKLKVNPTHLIIGPDQESQLLKDTSFGVRFENINVANGQVLTVAGLEAVVTPLANASTATANAIQAIIIDAKRAVGEAWGRRPTTTVDEVSKAEADQVKLVTWIRYGVAVLDLKAIGFIKNAAA